MVSEYRLIGYHNRLLERQDFNNDKKDAGEIGAGHSITAFYEFSYQDGDNLAFEKLRYGNHQVMQQPYDKPNELAFIKLRYKPIKSDTSLLMSKVIQSPKHSTRFAQASNDFRFAAAVAGLGQLLNGGQYLGDFNLYHVENIASSALGTDNFGYRHEFLQLVKAAALIEVSRQGVSTKEARAPEHSGIKLNKRAELEERLKTKVERVDSQVNIGVKLP